MKILGTAGKNTLKKNIKKIKPQKININHCLVSPIEDQEVIEAVGKMKAKKTERLDDIPAEVKKCLGEVGVQCLTELFK